MPKSAICVASVHPRDFSHIKALEEHLVKGGYNVHEIRATGTDDSMQIKLYVWVSDGAEMQTLTYTSGFMAALRCEKG